MLKTAPSTIEAIGFLGVLDCDQRGITSEHLNFPCCYLAGSRAPELWISEVLLQDRGRTAHLLQIPRETISAIASATEGVDHHDWLDFRCERTEVSAERLIPVVLTLAEADPALVQQLNDVGLAVVGASSPRAPQREVHKSLQGVDTA